MKIVINYELLDKIRQARTGISLKKCCQKIGLTQLITQPIYISVLSFANIPINEITKGVLRNFFLASYIVISQSLICRSIEKTYAEKQLSELATELKRFCVETDEELLKKTRKYQTEYSLNFENFPPQLEQKNYFMVPVHNEWDNKERSIVEEHVVGTRDYSLSYGEPDKKKVYKLQTAKQYSK